MPSLHLSFAAAAAAVLLGACASLQKSDPLEVLVAGVEPLPGEGMELRMLVKLRVQNPNDAPVSYDGVAFNMDVEGKRFASGVSADVGSVPRFGETVISVPVTISTFHLLRQAVGVVKGATDGKISYQLKGKVSGAGSGVHRFSTRGELDFLAGLTRADEE